MAGLNRDPGQLRLGKIHSSREQWTQRHVGKLINGTRVALGWEGAPLQNKRQDSQQTRTCFLNLSTKH